MLFKEIILKNPDGLKARPAAMLVQVAGRFTSKILIEKGNKKINAKSIMGVLSLNVKNGESIMMIIDGDDESEAIKALVALVESNFENV